MKRTALALTLTLALVLSAMVVGETGFLNLVFAQWDLPPPPSNPDENPPSINVLSPEANQIYNSSDVWLNFTVTKPETWLGDIGLSYGWTGKGYSGLGYFWWGRITFIKYNLDGADNVSIAANDPAWYNTILQAPYYKTLDFSFNLTELSDGPHSLIVSADGEAIYGNWNTTNVSGDSTRIDFIVNTAPPRITVTSPENKAYNTTDVPLSFTTNEPVSLMSYSLDGQENLTIAGNTTIAGLSNGLHTLTVYANDTVGNIGTSETISFTVDVPFPTTLVITASGASAVVDWRRSACLLQETQTLKVNSQENYPTLSNIQWSKCY